MDWYDFRPFCILFAWNFTTEKGCRRKPQDISDFIVEPISRRFYATTTPLSFSFLILSSAVPLPPEIMAPAWPILLPGGAV